MAAFREPVVVNQLGIRFFHPTSRRLKQLVWKDAHSNRDGHALRAEKRQPVFRIETTRRNPRIRQPVVRDVVEDVVSRQALGVSVEDASDQRHTCRVVVEHPRSQADGESAIPYSVCGWVPICRAYATSVAQKTFSFS